MKTLIDDTFIDASVRACKEAQDREVHRMSERCGGGNIAWLDLIAICVNISDALICQTHKKVR